MNVKHIPALKETLELIKNSEADAAELFYEELFKQKEGLSDRFASADMGRLKAELMRVLALVVEYLERRNSNRPEQDEFLSKLHLLGQRHRNEWNVADSDYELAKNAFLNVLEKSFSDRWEDQPNRRQKEINAWTAMFDWLADTMILGANELDERT